MLVFSTADFVIVGTITEDMERPEIQNVVRLVLEIVH